MISTMRAARNSTTATDAATIAFDSGLSKLNSIAHPIGRRIFASGGSSLKAKVADRNLPHGCARLRALRELLFRDRSRDTPPHSLGDGHRFAAGQIFSSSGTAARPS